MTEYNNEEYLTTEEARKYLGVTRRSLERYVEDNRITKYRRGITRSVFYKRSELDELMRMRPGDEERK